MYQIPTSGPNKAGSDLRSDARRNRQRILRAAARLLSADSTATTQQIADAAEVGRQTVYRRYPTREALIEAIVREAVAEFGAALDQVGSDSADGAEGVERLIHALARIGTDYPILLSGAYGVHGADGDRGGTTLGDGADLVGRFDAQISRGQKDGSIRSDLAPAVIRHSLFGALSMSIRGLGQPDGAGTDPDGIGEQVTSLIMGGLRPRGA